MSLIAHVDPSHPDAAAFEAFWRRAHSPAAALDDWSVALWAPVAVVPPRTMSPMGGAKAVIAGPSQPTIVLPLTDLPRVSGLDERVFVVLARPDLPSPVESILRRLGFVREIPNQQVGWWRSEGVDAKKTARARPHAALLMDAEGRRALLLVEVAGRFAVLSTRALWSYVPGEKLAQGERVDFIHYDANHELVTKTLALDEPMPSSRVAEVFGEHAAARLRADAQAAVVRIVSSDREQP